MPAVENQLFNIKFTAKQIHRMSKKCEKEHKQELGKVKKAIEKGDADSARIYAENAIRIKNTGNNYLRMASRLEAVASRLESAVKMQQVSKQMGSVVKGMDVRSVPAQNSARAAHPQRAAPTQSVLVISSPPPHAFWRRRTNPNRKLCPPQKILESMDMGKIGAVMEKFEASFDEAEVRSQYVENAMNSSTASTMPEEAVESLLQQVSDEHGLQFASRAADASTAPVAMSAPTAALEDSQEDALEKRLAALRTVG